MILRSIQVEGWRCFASPVQVGPFIDGLNIIHGPNGIGKSSLMMALARGLFDSHQVGGADIKTLRPWGRQLTPRVTIEFEEDGRLFQLQKQFLDSASARLSRQENGLFVPVAESRAADERARSILLGDPSSRGASDQRHWGLAQILWATQGSLKIDSLASGTQAAVQDALGAQIVGAGTEDLEQRIAARFSQFFTSQGSLRKGAMAPAIVGLERQLEKARQMRAELQQRLLEFESASRHIEDLQAQAQSARHSEQQLNDEVRKKREQLQVYQTLIGQQKQHQLEFSSALQIYESLAERIKTIEDTDKQLAANAKRLQQLNDDLPALEKQLLQCREEAESTDQSVKLIRSRRVEVTQARQLAQLAERHMRNQRDTVDLEKRLKQIDETRAEFHRRRELRKPIIAPDKKTLKKIIQIARQRDDARLQLESSLITVSIQLETDAIVEVTDGEQPGPQPVSRNEEHQIKGAPDVAFQIDGVGRLRAIGPAGDFEALREQWNLAFAKFNELTAKYGTDDLASLDALHTQAEELEKKIGQSEVKLNTLLDGKTVEQVQSELKHAKRFVEEVETDHPTWKSAPPDPAELARRADEVEQKINREIELAESADGRARDALQKGTQKRDLQMTEIAKLQAQASALAQRIESLRKDGMEDALRSKRLAELVQQREAAESKLALVEKQIRELGEDPSKSLTVLEQQQTAFRIQADEAEKKLNTESGRLDQIISEGPFSALVAAEEEIDWLEVEIARQRLEIDAIRLLHETVRQQKSDVLQLLIDPIRKRANQILRRISSSQFDGVQFDESLLPTGIAPRSHDDTVSFDQISGGEQEQVHFAVRMALADIAFPNDRQLVVLDDVFTYTDAIRLKRIAGILEDSAERFQIVLLTCHPERYQGLPNTKFFDLKEIAARPRKEVETVPRSQAKFDFGVGSA